MTNYEHYKSEIDKITRMGRMVAVEEKTGKITSCNQITCLQCMIRKQSRLCMGRWRYVIHNERNNRLELCKISEKKK